MEYNADKKEIKLDRELSKLDEFVVDFCRLFNGNYVLVSGYISIIFGRSRATEDVDLIVPDMDFSAFRELWYVIDKNDFECLNTSKPEEAFKMLKEHAIRFAKKGKAIPNIEFKTIRNEIGNYSFKNRIKVVLRKGLLYVSPIEMQIAYKLMLGKSNNEKDLEDAKHLYELFKERLNNAELNKLIKQFNAEKEFEIIK